MWKKKGILKEQVLTRNAAVKVSCGPCRFQQLGVASEGASRQILRGARAGDQTFALGTCQLPAVTPHPASSDGTVHLHGAVNKPLFSR